VAGLAPPVLVNGLGALRLVTGRLAPLGVTGLAASPLVKGRSRFARA
jgi:hypothetical protein